MSRLILVPQYPTKLRYQEWWYTMFPKEYKKYFNKVIVLGRKTLKKMKGNSNKMATAENFAPLSISINFELGQIQEFNDLRFRRDDILLLNDLSFPGFFPSILYHRRPHKCFAIIHATSKNHHDYFAEVRHSKLPTEEAHARMFQSLFIASQYHADKLEWSNTIVTPFPFPPFKGNPRMRKTKPLVSVARDGVQKRTVSLEERISKMLGIEIERPHATSWREYYNFLAKANKLLITAKEETYGYQIIDAILNNCTPLAPYKCSYPEMLPREFLYENTDELFRKLTTLSTPRPYLHPNISKNAPNFFERTATHMKEV